MEERAVCFGPESLGAHLSGRRQFLRLELLLREPPFGGALESVADPFRRVRGGGRLGSLFLARLSSNDGALDRLVTLKTLWDGTPAAGPRERPSDSNPSQFSLFQEEYRALRVLDEKDPDPIVRVAPFDLKAGRAVELPRHLPLLFCKRRRLFFSPRCERCGGALRDCQDDELLGRVGLQPYSSSNVRYLHCPSCSQGGAGARFYTAYADAGRGAGSGAGDSRALFESFGDLARQGRDRVADFPCADCPSTAGCYPPGGGGEVQKNLVPFSFHDFHSFVLEAAPLRFGESCDLLGGRDPAEIRATSDPGGIADEVPELRRFFGAGNDGREQLEVLLLKLSLCRELCLGVQAAHRRFRRPHLALGPDAVWVAPSPSNLVFPGAWDLRVRVTAPDHPVPAEPPKPGGGRLWRWPSPSDPKYAAPRGATAGAGPGYDLFGLGTLFLRALLVSRGQSADDLSAALSHALRACGRVPTVERPRALLSTLPAAVTHPRHLLWESADGRAPGFSSELWTRSLLLGLELLCRWESPEPEADLERAIQELDDLLAEVRQALFLDQPRRGAEIHRVLTSLLGDEEWIAAVVAGEPEVETLEPAPPPPIPRPQPPPEPPPVEDFEATIILGSGPGLGARPAVRPMTPPPPSPPPAEETDMEATIIAGRPFLGTFQPAAPSPAPAPPPEAAAPPAGAEDFEETIILPSPARKPKGPGER